LLRLHHGAGLRARRECVGSRGRQVTVRVAGVRE
jgi:hypothetical protein